MVAGSPPVTSLSNELVIRLKTSEYYYTKEKGMGRSDATHAFSNKNTQKISFDYLTIH